MVRKFIITSVFDKLWNRLGLTDDNLRDFQIVLMTNPAADDINLYLTLDCELKTDDPLLTKGCRS